MEQVTQNLDRFIRSTLCVFSFKAIDYPTQFQQHLITSYFGMRDILKNSSQSDMVRLLHSNDKYLQVFVPGLLYQMLLDPNVAAQYFDTYMPSLRTQSWIYLGKLALQLLQDSFSWIKPELRTGIKILLTKLHFYGQLSTDLVVLAVKTIDYTDMAQTSLNYNNEMLSFFQKLLTDPVTKTFSYILAKTLFYKLFRMLSILICMEDEPFHDYKMRCVYLAERLFELQRQKCLLVGNHGFNFLKELERQQILGTMIPRLMDAFRERQLMPQSPQSSSMRLSAVLPLKLQTTLLYIIREGVTKLQMKIQLDWIFNQFGQFALLMYNDVLRYILALPNEDLPLTQCLYIMEWLFYRVCSNNIIFELWKDQLFFACFAEPCPFPIAPERTIRFLAYILQSDLDFGENLLIYLIHRYGSTHPQALQALLTRASELGLIDLIWLMDHAGLRPRTKEELLGILGQRPIKRSFSGSEQPVTYFDPLENMRRKESEMSMQFSDSDQQKYEYLESPEQSRLMEVEHDKPVAKMGKVLLEKMFVQDMGDSLNQLLVAPSIEHYKQTHKQFLTLTKQFRVSGQQSLIEVFVTQMTKVTYLLFQKQFEDHHNLPSRQTNIIFYLLNIVAIEWRVNSFQLQMVKKIVKKLIQLFPTCEPAFWRHFLLNFKRTVVGSSRQIKDWLIPKEKSDIVLPLLKELGPVNRQLIQSAEQMRLPLVL